MPSAMVTFNGRITLPTDIRKQLGVKLGDSVDFVEIEQGRFAISVRPGSLHDGAHALDAPGAREDFNRTVH